MAERPVSGPASRGSHSGSLRVGRHAAGRPPSRSAAGCPNGGGSARPPCCPSGCPSCSRGRGVGIGCRASGVVDLDLDVHGDDDGPSVLAALADRLEEKAPETFTVNTPSGGRHLYFRAPMGCTIGSVSGGRTALVPGIDVRGPGHRSGGHLVGPGSIVDGRPAGRTTLL
ncbi:bifunctional DNA primase/polymerase [Streptomyces sp. NPDC054904]